ncbi:MULTISPECIES: Wadjet anti-phage system protein JetD domain-containing protein [unclassified Bradyrhizobium]|uniref:Wadjet anti-phage system protein JetD domain-containing protein n=1 Tax=unclassified Bradyrhizobium TaxID=2631580 RepID=UPI002FF2DAA8
MAAEPLLLREVSSRAFWGLSKLLDGRGDIVAALLEVDECPFPEQPVILNVHLWRASLSLLFVENHVSFERLRRRTDLVDTALVYSSGFRGAALRLRKPQGASIYYSRGCPDDATGAFEFALFSVPDISTFFWGDLDYSGMAILAALRSTFPNAQAWRPGYEPMVERLRSGEGHSPLESGKEGQRPIDLTGCPYADEVLIPTLKASGLFIDQE